MTRKAGSSALKKNSSTSSSEKRTFSSAEYAAAQKNLGDMYANGWGVPKDESKAQTFYRKAFDAYKSLGDIDAQFEISKLPREFGTLQYDYGKVFAQYQSRADSSDIKAKIRLGLMYAKGLGTQQDLYAAKKIIASIRKDVKIVDSEFIELCILTGNLDDALKFHAKAVQLFEIAAKNGDNNAPFELAQLNSYKELTNGI